MRYLWRYTGCTKAEEESLAHQWPPHQAEIESKVAMLSSHDSVQACVHVEHSEGESPWLAEAAIYLPQATVAATGEGAEAADALQRLKEKLSQRLDKLAEATATENVRVGDASGVERALERMHRQRNSGGFLFFLTPIMYSFRGYAARELRIRRELGELPANEVVVRDILDEALLRAWEDFGKRDRQQAIAPWLLKLLDAALDQLAHPLAETSLEDRDWADDMRTREELLNEWTELPTDPETVSLADLLPGQPQSDSWDALGIEDKQLRLAAIFNGMPRQQRQVLMLSAEGGFNNHEIADFQDRPLDEIEADLAAAQWAVRRMLSEGDYDEAAEKLEQADLRRRR